MHLLVPDRCHRPRDPSRNVLILLAVPARLERATFGLGNRCSIRLSYGTKPLKRLPYFAFRSSLHSQMLPTLLPKPINLNSRSPL
jgi:hypothetical protein